MSGGGLRRVLINRRSESRTDVRSNPASGAKADIPTLRIWARSRPRRFRRRMPPCHDIQSSFGREGNIGGGHPAPRRGWRKDEWSGTSFHSQGTSIPSPRRRDLQGLWNLSFAVSNFAFESFASRV